MARHLANGLLWLNLSSATVRAVTSSGNTGTGDDEPANLRGAVYCVLELQIGCYPDCRMDRISADVCGWLFLSYSPI